MELNKVIESRFLQLKDQRARLVEAWAPYVKAVEIAMAEKGQKMKDHQKWNIAQCLENAIYEGGLKAKSKIFETTYSDNITFLGVQLPVIAAILPTLVLDEIAIVQALDRRQGAVFYLDVKRGTTKGGDDTSGANLLTAKTGHAGGTASLNYATANVYNESLGSKGSGNVFSATMTSKPVVTGTTTVVVSTASAVEDTLVVTATNGTTDTLTGATLSGTVTLATGVIAVTGTGSSASAVASYRYNYEKATTSVPELNVNLSSTSLAAEDFILRTKYTLAAAIDLEKAHGLNFEEEMIKYLGGEIKFELDHRGIDLMVAAAGGADAATTPGTFTATVGDGQEWVFKKFQFMDFVKKASNNIFAKTKRAKANFIVCGLNAERIISQLAEFKENETAKPQGPHKTGTLKGMVVIVDPFIDDNAIVFGYRGDNFLEAGFVFAPYIPLFSTPTLVTSDLVAQKGFMSAAGYLVTNAGMFCKGSVTGLSY
jgi:hypothetical protein